MYEWFSPFVLIGIGAAGYAAYRYRQKHSANWTDKQRERFDLIASLVLAAALLGKFSFDVMVSNAAVKQSRGDLNTANRNLWESVKKLPLGMEVTTLGLESLRRDLDNNPEDLRAALGDTEFQELKNLLALDEQRIAKYTALKKMLETAKADLKQIDADLKDVKAYAAKFAELKPAADAAEAKRRLAPLGNFQITVTVKRRQETALSSLSIGIMRTRLECFDSERYAQNGESDVYTLRKVSKLYAEEVQQRLQKLGAMVEISEISGN